MLRGSRRPVRCSSVLIIRLFGHGVKADFEWGDSSAPGRRGEGRTTAPPQPGGAAGGADCAESCVWAKGAGILGPEPPRRRPHKLHIIRFLAGSKAHSFRCSSSSRGPSLPLRGTSPFRGRPDESVAECRYPCVCAFCFAGTPSPRPAAAARLPLSGGALARLRKSAAGSSGFFMQRGIQPRRPQGGAEGRFAARTPPVRGRGPSPKAMVRGSKGRTSSTSGQSALCCAFARAPPERGRWAMRSMARGCAPGARVGILLRPVNPHSIGFSPARSPPKFFRPVQNNGLLFIRNLIELGCNDMRETAHLHLVVYW